MLQRTTLFILLIVFVFGGYLLYQFKGFLFGPKILVDGLKEYSAVKEPLFEIRGTAKNISDFYLNGRKVFTDERGIFKENMLLTKGMNIIQLKARDRFGHRVMKDYYVILK